MTTTAQHYGIIDRDALKSKIDKKEKFQLWNVLAKDYYRPDANIAGSQWIPADELTEKVAREKAPSKDEIIVTYCGGGNCVASKQAAEKLSSLGYTNVFAYEGGLKDWLEAGLPLVKL